MHKSLDEFEIRPGPTTAGFSWQQIVILFEKRCCCFFMVVLDGILFILTGNDTIHKSWGEFEIWPDQTTGLHGNR